MEASPHTMAGSSSPALSPCSSTNLHMPFHTHVSLTALVGTASYSPQKDSHNLCHCSNTMPAEVTRQGSKVLLQ